MYILNDGIRMEICIVLFGSSIQKILSVSVINARRSILKKAAKSSIRYAGRIASPCRILLSCEWSLLMPVASCRTLIQRSLRSCLTCLQTRSSKGVFCWCFITLFFAAKLLLLWHISVAYFSTFAPPCGEFLHTKQVSRYFAIILVSFARRYPASRVPISPFPSGSSVLSSLSPC